MRRAVVAAVLGWLVSPLAAAQLQNPTSQTPNFKSQIGSQVDSDGVVAKYCVTCHNEKLKTGELALDVVSRGPVRDHAPVWEDVLHKLRAGAMPPMVPSGRPSWCWLCD